MLQVEQSDCNGELVYIYIYICILYSYISHNIMFTNTLSKYIDPVSFAPVSGCNVITLLEDATCKYCVATNFNCRFNWKSSLWHASIVSAGPCTTCTQRRNQEICSVCIEQLVKSFFIIYKYITDLTQLRIHEPIWICDYCSTFSETRQGCPSIIRSSQKEI